MARSELDVLLDNVDDAALRAELKSQIARQGDGDGGHGSWSALLV